MFRCRFVSLKNAAQTRRSAIFSLALLLGGAVQAQPLSGLLEQARSGEPTYMGAKANVQVAQARDKQAFAAMLPQLSATASTNDNHRHYHTRNSVLTDTRDRYNSYSTQLSLTQPLLHVSNIIAWRQAQAVVDQAEQQLAGAEQDLFAKIVSAWFDLLAARDGVSFTQSQAGAMQRQWEIVSRGSELGLYGPAQLEEARTKLDQALSDAVVAETEVQLKRAALEQLVGHYPQQQLPYLHGAAVLGRADKDGLDKWLEAIASDNPNILAAGKAAEAAAAEVKKQWSGHLPTLDIVASYGNNGQAVGGFPGQAGYDISQASLGLQLNVPLYSGGAQSGKVSEALAQKEKTLHELEAARRSAILNAKQAWFGWQGALARTKAGQQAIKSAQAALAQAKMGLQQGLKTEFDVLQAEQQMRAGQRDFRKGRYDQIVSYVRLLSLSGKLTDRDVAALDALLVDAPEAANPPVDGEVAMASGR